MLCLYYLTVDYFIQHGSNVFMAALDAKKAFDRVNHVKLFEKLIKRRFPAGIVKVLVDWYGKTFACVKWGNCYSHSVSVRSGIHPPRRHSVSNVVQYLY